MRYYNIWTMYVPSWLLYWYSSHTRWRHNLLMAEYRPLTVTRPSDMVTGCILCNILGVYLIMVLARVYDGAVFLGPSGCSIVVIATGKKPPLISLQLKQFVTRATKPKHLASFFYKETSTTIIITASIIRTHTPQHNNDCCWLAGRWISLREYVLIVMTYVDQKLWVSLIWTDYQRFYERETCNFQVVPNIAVAMYTQGVVTMLSHQRMHLWRYHSAPTWTGFNKPPAVFTARRHTISK